MRTRLLVLLVLPVLAGCAASPAAPASGSASVAPDSDGGGLVLGIVAAGGDGVVS